MMVNNYQNYPNEAYDNSSNNDYVLVVDAKDPNVIGLTIIKNISKK